jgi:hypothetical protein
MISKFVDLESSFSGVEYVMLCDKEIIGRSSVKRRIFVFVCINKISV